MATTLVNRWEATGSSGNTLSCTVSGATAGNLLVAVGTAREDLTTISQFNTHSDSITNGWSASVDVPFEQYSVIGATYKVADGNINDYVKFAVLGPSNVSGWDVVVYEFSMVYDQALTTAGGDLSADSNWAITTPTIPVGTPSSTECVYILWAIYSVDPNTSSAYSRINNPDSWTWDADWTNAEKTVEAGSTYYWKYSLGYKIGTTGDPPNSSMLFGGSNIDAYVTLAFFPEVIFAGMLGMSI
jgi:hypothetical protein